VSSWYGALLLDRRTLVTIPRHFLQLPPHQKNHQREDPDSHFLQNYSTKPREPSNASQCQKYVLDTDERDLQLPSFLIVSCATFFAGMGIE
jgi:hypothetical protein